MDAEDNTTKRTLRWDEENNKRQRKLRCAVVGLGRIGSTLEHDSLREKPCTHAGAITADPDCKLVAGCDIDKEARKAFITDWSAPVTGHSLDDSPSNYEVPESYVSARDYGPPGSYEPPRVYADFDEMLEVARPDILVVATYPESHRRLTEGGVKAGTPVVVCEKPLAHRLRDAKAIARIHRSGRAKIIVNHERRYSLDYREARRAVEEQRYGEILSVKGTLSFGSSLPRRKVLLHDGTHMLDAINFLVGASEGGSSPKATTHLRDEINLRSSVRSPLRLRRRFGSMRSTEKSAFVFGRAGDVPVSIEIGSQRDHLVFEIELAFEEGRIRVGNGIFSFERSEPSPYYEDYRSLLPDPNAPPAPEKTNYFSGMIADAVRSFREPQHEPLSSALDALEVMKFIRSAQLRF